jgi:hypothetical protein
MVTTITVLMAVFGRKLVHHFRGRVKRVGVDHDQPRLQRAEHHHRIGEAVGHLDRDAVAGLEAGDFAQVDGELIRQPIDLGVGEPALRTVGQSQGERGLRGVGGGRLANGGRHVRPLQRPKVRRG